MNETKNAWPQRATELKEGHRVIQDILCGPPIFLCGCGLKISLASGGLNAILYSFDLVSYKI